MTYALEGSIFIAGAADQVAARRAAAWCARRRETAALAARVPEDHGVYMVPAFVGLGAPHWDPLARGLICGLTLDGSPGAPGTRRARVGRLPDARPDRSHAARRRAAPEAMRVDGGMAANDWFCQFLADILEARVERPAELETTALGAAFLAGLATGMWPDSPRSQRPGARPRCSRPP